MTKEQLSDKLQSALTPIVESFVKQASPAASAQEDQRKAIEERRENARKSLGDDDEAFRAANSVLDRQLDELKVSDADQRKENRRLAAEALVHVTNNLRLPLKLKPKNAAGTPGAGGKAGTANDGRRNRKSGEVLAREVAAVVKALPRAASAFVPKSDITEKVGFDPTSALLKLKRTGEAVSNGRRGAGGGWRRA